MNIAVVTGASSGLGVEFARLLDREPNIDCIWLIARREEALRQTASLLSTPARVFALDLLEPDAAMRLTAALASSDTIGWLVNNAGAGIVGAFSEQSAEDQRLQVRLNSEIPLVLTRSFEPYFRRGSCIINVASVAGFLPQPGFAAYASTKAQLLSFSRALNEEWKLRGIHVSVSCPNPMDTEFFLISERRGKHTSALKNLGLESPGRVAAAAIRRVKKGTPVSVTHPLAKGIRLAAKLLPVSVIFWFMRRLKIGRYD